MIGYREYIRMSRWEIYVFLLLALALGTYEWTIRHAHPVATLALVLLSFWVVWFNRKGSIEVLKGLVIIYDFSGRHRYPLTADMRFYVGTLNRSGNTARAAYEPPTGKKTAKANVIARQPRFLIDTQDVPCVVIEHGSKGRIEVLPSKNPEAMLEALKNAQPKPAAV